MESPSVKCETPLESDMMCTYEGKAAIAVTELSDGLVRNGRLYNNFLSILFKKTTFTNNNENHQ